MKLNRDLYSELRSCKDLVTGIKSGHGCAPFVEPDREHTRRRKSRSREMGG